MTSAEQPLSGDYDVADAPVAGDYDAGDVAGYIDALELEYSHDVGYLLGLISEALADSEPFDTDHDAALWAVAQWCQEVNVRPDLSDLETGECITKGEQKAEHPRYPDLYGEDYQ